MHRSRACTAHHRSAPTSAVICLACAGFTLGPPGPPRPEVRIGAVTTLCTRRVEGVLCRHDARVCALVTVVLTVV
jgi:hypothetical protein